jgi:uncharacterized membrane protein YtjA (UPF0391 family)
MLFVALICFFIAMTAALFGFDGLALISGEIARAVFIVFFMLFIVSLCIGGNSRRHPRL